MSHFYFLSKKYRFESKFLIHMIFEGPNDLLLKNYYYFCEHNKIKNEILLNLLYNIRYIVIYVKYFFLRIIQFDSCIAHSYRGKNRFKLWFKHLSKN